MTIIDNVNSPEDIKKFTLQELECLAKDIRKGILTRVEEVGGHLGPDLGIVEATIALHYVFNSPKDKFIFDVSHQCYPHKMITGRKNAFFEPKKYPEISGYTNPAESEHDTFVVGHTSTSVSLATGVAKARDLKNEDYNVIAIIGDGSLSGGEAFEGLNNASVLDSNIIIVVNDNEMSIAENQGGLYTNLAELRNTQGKAKNNFFKVFGFDYFYLEEGNDIQKLIDIFKSVKDTNKPTVVHIHTVKGQGYMPAILNKELFHWTAPHLVGYLKDTKKVDFEDYLTITNDYILEKRKTDKTIIAINPATPGAVGFPKEIRDELNKNFTDVGIAEEHAIAYASALAKNGAKPILAIQSSFMQRTYDQLSQDLALNNSPATILVHWAGLSSADMTHLGCFDIPLIINIPNIVYLAPTNKEEYLQMLDWSVNQNEHPVAIRVPFGKYQISGIKDTTDYSILNKYQVVEQGQDIAIIGVGTFFNLAKDVKEFIKQKLNINSTLINPKFISGLDEELLSSIKSNHKIVITLESGVLAGGFGEKIASFYGKDEIRVLNYGAKKVFTDRVSMNTLLQENRLTKEQITQDVEEILKQLLQTNTKH